MAADVSSIKAVLGSKKKPKEKIIELAEVFKADGKVLALFVEQAGTLTVSERGNCFSAMTLISKENPRALEDHLEFVAAGVNDKAPRVKWEASEILGNVAREFPEVAAKAIPALLKNAADDGTVVKWSAAFALTEIAKANPKTQAKLIPYFTEAVESEENNAVRKMYENTLKALQKKK
jgi:hypothetical protein